MHNIFAGGVALSCALAIVAFIDVFSLSFSFSPWPPSIVRQFDAYFQFSFSALLQFESFYNWKMNSVTMSVYLNGVCAEWTISVECVISFYSFFFPCHLWFHTTISKQKKCRRENNNNREKCESKEDKTIDRNESDTMSIGSEKNIKKICWHRLNYGNWMHLMCRYSAD